MKTKLLLAAVSSAALMLASGAWADGGPEPEAPPPAPPAPEPSPVYEPAPAPEYSWYTTIFAGAAFGDDLETTFDFGQNESFTQDIPLETGFLLGWTLGYDNLFNGDVIQFRPEVELSFRQQDVDFEDLPFRFEGDLPDNVSVPADVLSLLGNLWVDFELDGFTPYVGGGVGIGWVDLPIFEGPFHIESTDFVWQFGGGVNFDVNERIFLGVGYRYFGGDFEEDVFGANVSHEFRTHEVMANLGVRF